MAEAFDGFSTKGKIRSPADLLLRKNYVAKLEVNDPKLAEVLEPYHFDHEYPCGRAGCGKGHKEGYLIRVSTGLETNIGWRCGEILFGKDFAVKANARAFQARLNYQREILNNSRSRKDVLLKRIADLLNRQCGIKWAEKTLKSFKDIIGPVAVKTMHDRARRDDTSVTKVREATQIERENHKFKDPSARPLQYIEEKIGDFIGLAFFNENLECSMTELKEKIHELDRIDVVALSPQKRKKWVDWANNIDRTIDQVEDGLANALRFFCQSNLDLAFTLDSRKLKSTSVSWSATSLRFITKNK
ncbi:hypothetical protein [Collimonas sp.]|jgi:hypothetical protein|uniref:hypothetical protein n=1 Tax=Collimonas sp. TaxID=1963772 RepID=UPI002C1A36B2|nr:hypothetical protein [Collimonas sp.]HWW05880.1 hypothetical protein [Collimonas sp.]